MTSSELGGTRVLSLLSSRIPRGGNQFCIWEIKLSASLPIGIVHDTFGILSWIACCNLLKLDSDFLSGKRTCIRRWKNLGNAILISLNLKLRLNRSLTALFSIWFDVWLKFHCNIAIITGELELNFQWLKKIWVFRCNDDWTGTKCDQKPCDPRCAEHGQCKNGTCVCSQGWNGRHCTLRK